MDRSTLTTLVNALRAGDVSRRDFLARAAAMGISGGAALSLANAAAQAEGSPAASPATARPAASPLAGEAVKSITRQEYTAALKEHFQIQEVGNPGGLF